MKVLYLFIWGVYFTLLPWVVALWFQWTMFFVAGDNRAQDDTFQRLVVAMGWFVIFLLTAKVVAHQQIKNCN